MLCVQAWRVKLKENVRQQDRQLVKRTSLLNCFTTKRFWDEAVLGHAIVHSRTLQLAWHRLEVGGTVATDSHESLKGGLWLRALCLTQSRDSTLETIGAAVLDIFACDNVQLLFRMFSIAKEMYLVCDFGAVGILALPFNAAKQFKST